MNVFKSEYQTSEKLAGKIFVKPMPVNNEIKQLASFCMLHYKVKLVLSLNNFVKLDDTWVSNRF